MEKIKQVTGQMVNNEPSGRKESSNINEVFVSPLTEEVKYDEKYSLDLSIIIPVYNVEKYLEKCLSSVLKTEMSDYEVIIVNDGTKDNSQTIIDKYVEKYPDIVKSFIKENGGLADARNYGLLQARGKYISFLDSDDYVEEGYYKGMYELADENDLDLVVADLEYVWENNEKKPVRKEGIRKVDREINRRLFLSSLFAWNKMYRHELLTKLNCQYPVGLWYEDIPVTLKVFAYAKRVGYYRNIGVHYLQRKSSIMGSAYSEKMYDIFRIFEKITDEIKNDGLYSQYHDELEYLYIEHFLIYGAFRFLRTDHYKELMKKAFEFVSKEFPDYRSNRYLKLFRFEYRLFVLVNNSITAPFWHWYLTHE